MDMDKDSKEDSMAIEQEKENHETKNSNPSRKRKGRDPPDFEWTKYLQPILPETIVYITKTCEKFHLTQHDKRAILTKTTYGEVAAKYPNMIRCSAKQCILDERDKKLKYEHEKKNRQKNEKKPANQERRRQYRAAHPEKFQQWSREYEERNKEKRKLAHQEYEKTTRCKKKRKQQRESRKPASKEYHKNWYQQHVKPEIEAKKQHVERLTGSILSYLYAPYEVPSITISKLIRSKVKMAQNNGKEKKQPNRGKWNRPRDYLRRMTIEIQGKMKAKKEKGIESDLDEILIQTLILQPCFYCGRETDVTEKETINGLDRLNSSFGYILDNVVPCCHDCNMRKWTLDYSTFLQCIKNILNLYNRCYDHFNNNPHLLKGSSYTKCKHGAAKRGFDFKLSEEDFSKIFNSKDLSCYCCGYSNRSHLSLDRIDNDVGYEVQNVQVCCVTCNYMRKNLPIEEFVRQCNAIYKYMKTKNWPSETAAKKYAQNIWQMALQSNSHALVKTRQPREKPLLHKFSETEHVYYLPNRSRFHRSKCDIIKNAHVQSATFQHACEFGLSPCGRCCYG
jgi:hypothetical protein